MKRNQSSQQRPRQHAAPRQRAPQRGKRPPQWQQAPYYNERKRKNTLLFPLIAVSILALVFLVLWISKPGGDEALKEKISQLEKQNKELSAQLEVNPEAPVQPDQEQPVQAVSNTKQAYGANQDWIVDGQWRLQVHSAIQSDERNEYSDKKPGQVVIVSYTYENLGYEGDIMELYLIPARATNGLKKMGYSYPVTVTIIPQQTPVGALCEGAQEVFAFDDVSDEITLYFEKYDNAGNKQKARFTLPIQ
ncbi:MAG: hypothetical protein Q4P65_00915 [Eubacteriales bacterium]|nr:hypothetical protein [Eubacteriales bacterium]